MLSKISNITRMCDCHRSVCIMRSQSKFQFKTKICLIFLTLLEKTSRGAYSDVKMMLTAISAEAYNTFYTLCNLGRLRCCFCFFTMVWNWAEPHPAVLWARQMLQRGTQTPVSASFLVGDEPRRTWLRFVRPRKSWVFFTVCVCDSPEQLISSFSLLRTQWRYWALYMK